MLTGDTNSEYYCESNCLPNSYCMITYTINKWKLGYLPDKNYRLNSLEQKEPTVGWVIRNNNRVYEHSERTTIDWFVFNCIKNKYRDDDFENTVCYSIISKYIDDAIAGVFKSGNYNFEALLKALYPNDIINYNDFVIRYYNSSQHMANTLARALRTNNEFLQQLILHFCFLALNSPANLRIGNSNWNGVIKENLIQRHGIIIIMEKGRIT